MLVGQGDQLLQCFQRYQRTGRVAWRAEEEDLTALPDFRGHGVEIRVEAVLFEARQVVWRGSGEQRCAFVDLIERIGADHQPIGVAIDHGLGEGEQCFACPVHRQDMARRVQRLGSQAETPFAPTGDGFAQRRNAERGRIDRELVELSASAWATKSGERCLGSPIDRAMARLSAGGWTPASSVRSFSNG